MYINTSAQEVIILKKCLLQTSVIKQGKDIVSKFSSKRNSLYAKCNDNQWLKSAIQGRNMMIAKM